VREPERLARDGAARVEVHRQALAGIEQLGQQARVGAETGDVLGAQPRLRIGSDRVADERAVVEPGEAAAVAGRERRVDRPQPFLGHVVVGDVEPAQRRDLGAPGIEVMQRVRG
jgi:hypothetical protein